MVRDEVQDHPDSPARCLADQPIEGSQSSELRRDVEVVGDVVSPIAVGARVNRVQPDRIDTEPREVIEAHRHAVEVTDAVAVAVLE